MSGSRLFRIRVRDRVHVWVRIRVRVGGFVSGFVSSSCLVRIWFTSDSYLDPYAILVLFSFVVFRSVRQEWPDRPIAYLSGRINIIR